MIGVRGVRKLGRRLLRFTLLGLVPVIAIVVGLSIYARTGRYVTTENAYVKANIVAVSADVSGRVVEVGVEDNHPVSPGDLLFRIDPVPFGIAVAEAEAQMAIVRAEIEQLRFDYREAVVQAEEVRERVRFLERQHRRQERLMKRGMGSEESYDQALHELNVARRHVRVLEERIQRTLARLGGDPELPVEEHPRYRRAVAIRDQAAVDLERTTVLAPAAGIVSNMKLQAGEYVEEGEPIFSLIERSPMWVEANLKETQLTHVREGQRASVVIDAYPGTEWLAVVSAIAPATGAEFALLPPQNATGNWVKVVQRVPVSLRLEPAEDAPTLRAGMTAEVSIDVERERELPTFARAIVEYLTLPEFLRKAFAVDQTR